MRSNIIIILTLICLYCRCSPPTIQYKKREVSEEIEILKKKLDRNNADSIISITDDLIKKLNTNSFDNPSIQTLYKIRESAFTLLKKNDSAIASGKKVRECSILLNDSISIYESLINIYNGSDYEIINDVSRFIYPAFSYFKARNEYYKSGVTAALYAMYLESNNKFKDAQTYFFSALNYFEKIDSIKAMAKTCNNIGNNFSNINSIDESLKYYRLAIKLARKINNKHLVASALMNMGINFRKSKPDSSLLYYEKALYEIPLSGSERLKLKIQYNIANLYLDQNKFVDAESQFKKILNESRSSKVYEGVGMSYSGLGAVETLKGRLEESINYYQKAISLFDSIGLIQNSFILLPQLSEVYVLSKKYKEALEMERKIRKLSDSILMREKAVALHKLEKEYQFEKKEGEIRSLMKENKQKIILIFFLFIIAILFFLMFFLRGRLLRERNYAYEVLMKKYAIENNKKIIANKIDSEEKDTVNTDIKKAKSLYENLNNYFEKDKPYLNSKLKVTDISDYFGVNQKELSELLSAKGEYNFSTYCNKYRVEEAKRLFENNEYSQLKMEVIASKAGFGTIQSFYNSFEKFTGVKPSYFRNQINKK